jgi:DNA sulfur modification protein DndD
VRFRRIQLHNFRPYHGDVVVAFPETPASDFYLVHGQNGYGKTSLLLAVQWALYGEGRVRDVFEHLNTRARSEDGRVAVELSFEHEGQEYQLRREARASKVPVAGPQDMKRSSLSLYRNGVPVNPPDAAQDRIESMLPRDASQFFLFDAEKNNRYSAKHLSDETRAAIELVLGLRPVQNARDDAESLRVEILRRRNEELRKNEAHKSLASEAERLQEELAVLSEHYAELSEQIQNQSQKLDEYRSELDRLAEVQSQATERDRLRARVDEVERERATVIEELQKEARALYLRVLQPKVAAAYEECYAQHEALRERESAARQRDAIGEYLTRLLEVDRCVCGRTLADGHREHIERELARFSSASSEASEDGPTSTEIAAQLEALRRARSKVETAARRFEELQVKKIDLDEELSALETRLAQVENQIKSIDLDQANTLRELISELERELVLSNREQAGLAERIEQKKKELAAKEREVRKLSEVEGVVKALTAQADLLERTRSAFEALLARSATARRGTIEDRANEFFRKITNKQHGFASMFIADDFTFGIRAADGSSPDMDNIAEGEKQVVAFCFVMGLNRYARTQAPVMIDTPMARLDKVHRVNMANSLRDIGQQTILFVTDMDLEAGVGEIFADFVDREFEILHDQETLSSTIAVKGETGG